MANNLIAYIPALNRRHVDWLKGHSKSDLLVIPQEVAEEVVPRLARNIIALPDDLMLTSLSSLWLVHRVFRLPNPTFPEFQMIFEGNETFMPDEDVSHALHEKYFPEAKVSFEMIWARYDMTAVKRQSPVITDVVVSHSVLDNVRMNIARSIAPKSPDWWRQIGAVAFRGDELIACSCNTHLPNEYVTYIFGDPRINVDAGQSGVYSSTHAEKVIVALCAADGKALRGSSLYVTTFPCEVCAREIGLAGIKKLFFEEGYSTLDAQEVLRAFDVEIIRVIKNPVG